MKRSRAQPMQVAAVLRALFHEKKWDKRIALHQIFPSWEQVVGAEIGSHTRPEVIRGTVLWVQVTDSVWMQQLHLQKMLLLERLNRFLKDAKLTDIRFHLASTRDWRQTTAETVPPVAAKVREPAPLPDHLEKLIAALPEEEMREAVRNAYRKGH